MKYNIIQGLYIIPLYLFIFLIHPSTSFTQQLQTGKYGLSYINKVSDYRESVKKDSLKQMVNLQYMIHTIVLDLRYAGTNNFMGKRMYPRNTHNTYLRLPAALALRKVQQELNNSGFGLKIFDAYRPYNVTEKFWELVHDDRYVADPKKGSGHNRGIAVDLTLINLHTGEELAMPTGFDNFTDSAHQDFMQLPDYIIRNRELLKNTMVKFGFIPFATEWWHFSLPNPEQFEVLDLSFKELEE
jgi:D-alanyl-D-alanine dipeptidase